MKSALVNPLRGSVHHVVNRNEKWTLPPKTKNMLWIDFDETVLNVQPSADWKYDGNKLVEVTRPTPPSKDVVFDRTLSRDKVLDALIQALNDGSFVSGSNYPAGQIKAIIKNKMR